MLAPLKNPFFYRKNFPCWVSGFIVPKEFIAGLSLAELERTLGFNHGRLGQGAAFAELERLPAANELEYFGDTRTPEHRFNEKRNTTISKADLDKAAYAYFQPNTRLIKVMPIKNFNPMLSEDENFPPGKGAMQFKLKRGIQKLALVIDVVENYPFGRFGFS